MSEHTFVANGQTHCRCGLPELERLAAPSPALTRDYTPLETAATILLSTVKTNYPEHSPYGCPHSRDWLVSLLDDLAAALSKIPPPTEDPDWDWVDRH